VQNAPIIIKKVKKVSGGGHHGGAWKVAYADFVTAMMAFFLLMWLINATSPEQKKGIADYFAPAAVSESRSGSGGVLGGKSFDSEGARDSGYSSMTMSERAAAPRSGNEDDNSNKNKKRSNANENAAGSDSSKDALNKAAAKSEADMFEKAAVSLRQAMRDMPELAELSKHLIIDQTPEGMRIQIVDQEGRSMFQAGSVEPYPRTQLLLREIAKVINRLPNRITISGHTDASQVESTNGYTNWELSSDRANAARRIFQKSGVRSNRIYQVAGKASSEPLFPDDPYMSANRRISVVLLREAPVLPPDHAL
jgi:chemotaxis protein MotB